MKKLLLTLALCIFATAANAQCTGIFPNNTFCGNQSGLSAPPKPINIPNGLIVGPLSSTVGDIAVWNNLLGTSLKDTPPLQIFGTQSANTFLSGPTSGGAAFPTYRTQVDADIPSVFTTARQFQGGLSFGPSAPAPATAALYGYNATASSLVQLTRDQNLSIGSLIGTFTAWGKDSGGTLGEWAQMTYGVNDCRVKLSNSGGPCAGDENTNSGQTAAWKWYVNDGPSTLNQVAKMDDDGLWVIGARNFFVPAGQGYNSVDSSGTITYVLSYNSPITVNTAISIASPAVVTLSVHNLIAGTLVSFNCTGGGCALPTGITAGVTYYVINPTTNTFQISATPSGTAVNTSGSQSGQMQVSYGTNEIDIQACNNLGIICANGWGSIAFLTDTGANNGRKMLIDNTEGGRVLFSSHVSYQSVASINKPTSGGAWNTTILGSDAGGTIAWTAATSGTLVLSKSATNALSCIITFRAGATGHYDVTDAHTISFTSLSSATGNLDYRCNDVN